MKKKSFNKAEYDAQYSRENHTRVSVVLSKKYDNDIIETLQDKPSKSDYIKRLIREDLQKSEEPRKQKGGKKMKEFKTYGNQKTALKLTKKAQEVYNNSDPLEIREYSTENGYTYTIRGLIDREGLTAQDVNDILEEFYDD